MKLLTHCPFCARELIESVGYDLNQRYCSIGISKNGQSIEHSFWIYYDVSGEILEIEMFSDSESIFAEWVFENKLLFVDAYQDAQIPFFDPDFSDLPKLLEKIKTYMVFS